MIVLVIVKEAVDSHHLREVITLGKGSIDFLDFTCFADIRERKIQVSSDSGS